MRSEFSLDLSEDKKIYDVIIIGGGPGGLTAAQYVARAQLSTVIRI